MFSFQLSLSGKHRPDYAGKNVVKSTTSASQARAARNSPEPGTYASEMLRAGVDLPALMKLLGHAAPEMTMVYLDIALTDLQREFQLARSQPRHSVPLPRTPASLLRPGFDGLLDSLRMTQHVVEMYRRTLPGGSPRRSLDRLVNKLTKILSEVRKLQTSSK